METVKLFGMEIPRSAEGGGIIAGEIGVGAMHQPLGTPVETQVPTEHLQPVENHPAAAAEEGGDGGERVVGDRNGSHQIEKSNGVAERPQLEEGYYELEAIRKKKTIQGVVKYQIKWRGYPESSNTWEPIENLSRCLHVVDAFERRSQSRSRKGSKHKSRATKERQENSSSVKGTTESGTKKRRLRLSTSSAKDDVPATEAKRSEEPVPFPCLNDIALSTENSKKSEGPNELLLITDGSSTDKTIEHQEEAKVPGDSIPTDGSSADKTIEHQEEAKVPGDSILPGFANTAHSVRVGFHTRFKRMSARSIVRFKQEDSSADGSDDVPEVIMPTDGSVAAFAQEFEHVCNSNIIKIIKPLCYKAPVSKDDEDPVIIFEAKRSDGKVVTVDNGFLKANEPLLLIQFFEKLHARYFEMIL